MTDLDPVPDPPDPACFGAAVAALQLLQGERPGFTWEIAGLTAEDR